MTTAQIDLSGTLTNEAKVLSDRGERRGLMVHKPGSGDLWIKAGGTASAAAGSIKIPAGGTFWSASHLNIWGTISIFGAGTAMPYTAWEW